MIFARCPECKRYKAVIGRHKKAYVVRTHSADRSLVRFDSVERWSGPLPLNPCRGSGRPAYDLIMP